MKQFIKILLVYLTMFAIPLLTYSQKPGQSLFVDGVHYKFGDGQFVAVGDVEVVGLLESDKEKTRHLTIPSQILGKYTVSRVASLKNNDWLESVVFSKPIPVLEGAFAYNRNLKSVVGGSWSTIGNDTFYGCSSLESFDLTTTKTIGERAFEGCGFKTITIPESVTKIEDNAFYCYNATKLIIESTKLDLGSHVWWCTIEKIEIYSEYPPWRPPYGFPWGNCFLIEEGNSLRYACFWEICELYVPKGCIDNYRGSIYDFVKIYDTLELSDLESVKEADNEIDVIAVYDVNGRLTTPDMPGIVIKRYSDGSVKKVFNN